MKTEKPMYLAGPMSGLPQFNFPMFDAVASILRVGGWNIQSPAENDEEVRAAAMASKDGAPLERINGVDVTWGDFLARDVKLLADYCDGIILLPGWAQSRGARLEAFVALLCDLPVYQYQVQSGCVQKCDHFDVMRVISGVTVGGDF